jgi:hypothetical protein
MTDFTFVAVEAIATTVVAAVRSVVVEAPIDVPKER